MVFFLIKSSAGIDTRCLLLYNLAFTLGWSFFWSHLQLLFSAHPEVDSFLLWRKFPCLFKGIKGSRVLFNLSKYTFAALNYNDLFLLTGFHSLHLIIGHIGCNFNLQTFMLFLIVSLNSMQEIAMLSQFEHENIVQYYGTDKVPFLSLHVHGSGPSLLEVFL